MIEDTQPNSIAVKRPRRAAGRKPSLTLRLLAALLAVLVGANLCVTLIFVGVYYTARARAIAAHQTPPHALEVLRTLVPFPTTTAAPTPTLPPPTGIVNVLLMGVDQRPDETGQPTRTDTMIVLRVDFDNSAAKLLSFPRDVWVALPNLESFGISEGRINTAYYYGEVYGLPGGGPREAMDTVSLNFGIPLDHYALVNFDGFVSVVDALGGIDINVPERIYDENFPTEDYGYTMLVIEPGWQHMDGTLALRYARTRHQDSDTERIKRQQLVLLAIRDQAISADAVSRLPELYTAFNGSFATDMDLPTLISYGLAGQQIDRSQIKTYAIDQTMLVAWTTPGGANVWIPWRASIAPVVEAFLAAP